MNNFTCETEEVLVEQELEDYELDEEFVLEFVSISHAISVNECSNHFEKEEIVTFRGMLERENRILKILQEEMQL